MSGLCLQVCLPVQALSVCLSAGTAPVSSPCSECLLFSLANESECGGRGKGWQEGAGQLDFSQLSGSLPERPSS